MKVLVVIISSLISVNFLFAQQEKDVTSIDDVFKNYCGMVYVEVNTTQLLEDSTQIWQVTQPSKSIINYAQPGDFPNGYALITDSLDPYPVNDSSKYLIRQEDRGGLSYEDLSSAQAIISGYYWSNTDTLNDYGTIEIKLPFPDNWINILGDSIYSFYDDSNVLASDYLIWNSPKPVLSGNTNGWQYFEVDIQLLGQIYDVGLHDTISYRFRFHSDSIFDSLDGLAFDEIQFCNYAYDDYWGISEFNRNAIIQLSPNPAINQLQVKTDYPWGNYEIYSTIGEIVQSGEKGLENNIDVSTLREGIYLVSIIDKNQRVGTGRFVKE